MAFAPVAWSQDTIIVTQYPVQDSAVEKRYRVAFFSPLYLDSAFDASMSYRYGSNFPKFFNSGLEFFEGAQLAYDTLETAGVPLDIYVYDTRSPRTTIPTLIANGALDSMDLMIGHVNGTESVTLARYASRMNIPFVNATYPNDAGITDNPYYVLLNSTLHTHCAAIYKYIQKYHALSSVVIFRKKGAQEDRLKTYFEQIGKTTASVPLKIKFVTLEDGFTAENIRAHLNADLNTVCIAGSLDVNFGNRLTQYLAYLKADFSSTVIGMPTWWDLTDFSKPEYKGMEVVFTTPFYISPEDSLAIRVEDRFKGRFYSKPTDIVFRGYDALFHFARLLHASNGNLGASLSDKKYTAFTAFDIQPVIDPKSNTLNYFENKKIYYVKKVDGVVTEVR